MEDPWGSVFAEKAFIASVTLVRCKRPVLTYLYSLL